MSPRGGTIWTCRTFGLPVIDKLFGTAYLPRHQRPTGFGIDDPVPANSYLGHLAYPFTRVANGRVEVESAG